MGRPGPPTPDRAHPVLTDRSSGLTFRAYGTGRPRIVVLHGGPGAAGYMGAVCRHLSSRFRVFEPFQRGSGEEPLTVERHVADLHHFISSPGGEEPGDEERPVLVGHSWGAMLALAYAARHPSSAVALALIGCGTFDPVARARMNDTLAERIGPKLRQRLEALERDIDDPDARMAAMAKLVLPVYSYALDLSDAAIEPARCDERAHRETWNDMLRLQSRSLYPGAFEAIRCPVIMLHGAGDPHPGRMVYDRLRVHLPQLEYLEFARCGHYPWLERSARSEFYTALIEWLAGHAAAFAHARTSLPRWRRNPGPVP